MVFNNKEKISANTYKINFSIEPEIFNKSLNKVFIKQSKKINISGFRKGKAPKSVIEKMYGESVFYDDALNNIWSEEFNLALESAEIKNFIAVDKIDVLSVSVKDGAHICVNVVTKPEVILKKYKNIKVTKKSIKVREEEIESNINYLAKRIARIVTITDRSCKMGDIVNVDFEGFVDGEPFEGGKCQNYILTLGSKEFVADFEEQIAGRNIGDEFKVNVKFPEDYIAEQIAGKFAEFDVKLNGIQEYEMPVIDDEFAKDVSEFDTLAILKEDIKVKLLKIKEEDSRAKIEAEIFDVILAEMQTEIPKIMYKRRMENLTNEFVSDLKRNNIELESYLKTTKMSQEDFKNKFMLKAERQIKVELALEKICELERIDTTDEELNNEIEKIAKECNVPLEDVEKLINIEDLKFGLKLEKAKNLLVESAEIDREV